MGAVKDLQNEAAVEKIQELVQEVMNTCMFCTDTPNALLDARPMSAQLVDDNGTIWFLSDKDSQKNQEIGKNSQVQLIFCNTSSSHYLSISGKAEISFDQHKIDELWEPLAKAWFTEGPKDQRISVIKVTPEKGYYWDTKHGKMISLVMIVGSAITGKSNDDGIEGKLEVK